MAYAQAPWTPGLVEEPNLANVQDASACNDHLESEYHLESTIRGNANSAPCEYKDANSASCEYKEEVNWCSRDDTVSDAVPQGTPEENGYLIVGLEFKESILQGQFESIKPASQFTKKIMEASDISLQEDYPTESLVLRPCNSIQENRDVKNPGVTRSTNADLQFDSNPLASDGGDQEENLGKVYCANGDSEHSLTETLVQGHISGEDILVVTSEADGLVHTTILQDRLVVNINNPIESEVHAPEKLLSVPESHIDLHKGMMIEVSPMDVVGCDEAIVGSKTAATGRKCSFTGSTLLEQSLRSVEFSREVLAKQTTGSVPNDDDLLSSILVGRLFNFESKADTSCF